MYLLSYLINAILQYPVIVMELKLGLDGTVTVIFIETLLAGYMNTGAYM